MPCRCPVPQQSHVRLALELTLVACLHNIRMELVESLSLRHRQVGAGGIKTLGGGRTVLSMEEILESLTTKARVEAEDAQRQMLGALNGLAALMLLSDDHNDDCRSRAVATYRQALTTGTVLQPHHVVMPVL